MLRQSLPSLILGHHVCTAGGTPIRLRCLPTLIKPPMARHAATLQSAVMVRMFSQKTQQRDLAVGLRAFF